MFSAIKKGPAAAKPSMSIDKSAMQQLKGTELRGIKRKAHNAAQISSTGLWTRLPTSEHLTTHMEGIACTLFDLGSEWAFSRESPTEWLVYAAPWCAAPEDSPLPAFDQLYQVVLIGGKWMTCTCGLPHRLKIPCFHIQSITCTLQPAMFHIRWHSLFQHYYLVDKEMTAIFNVILKEPFIGIDASSIDVICGNCSCIESHLRMLSLQAAISSGHSVLIGEILESESKCTPAGVMMTGLNNSFEESSF
jgi:hypothetical protein